MKLELTPEVYSFLVACVELGIPFPDPDDIAKLQAVAQTVHISLFDAFQELLAWSRSNVSSFEPAPPSRTALLHLMPLLHFKVTGIVGRIVREQERKAECRAALRLVFGEVPKRWVEYSAARLHIERSDEAASVFKKARQAGKA